MKLDLARVGFRHMRTHERRVVLERCGVLKY